MSHSKKLTRLTAAILSIVMLIGIVPATAITASAEDLTSGIFDYYFPLPVFPVFQKIIDFFSNLFTILGFEKNADKFTVYDLTHNAYLGLFDNLNGIFEDKESITATTVYTALPGIIKSVKTSGGTAVTTNTTSSYPKIGSNVPVSRQLINFVGNTKEIEKYLAKNGVNGKAEEIFILNYAAIPATITATVNGENYFITINEGAFADIYNTSYKFYDSAAYAEKFAPKAATVIVEGNILSAGATMHYRGTDLPLLAILRELGAEVEWLSESLISVIYEGAEYNIDTEEETLTILGDEDMWIPIIGNVLHFSIFSGTNTYARTEVIGDEFMVDSNVMSLLIICVLRNINLAINYAAQTITITAETTD